MAVWKTGFYVANNPSEFETYKNYGDENLEGYKPIPYLTSTGKKKFILIKLP